MFPDITTLLAGPSPAMSRLHGQIRHVAPYFRTALLTGERDCGEEAAARQLHRLSPLAHRPFLQLTTAELRNDMDFSHGTVASEGMIYLPRPELLPPSAQQVLLRLLRERGPQVPRVVAFAENGIRSLVSIGTFSPELADPLAALRVPLPPLRERTEDLPHLLTAMLNAHAAQLGLAAPEIAADLFDAGARELWPGNLEQLRTVTLALLKRASSAPLRAADLKAVLGAMPRASVRERRQIRMVTLDRVIQEHIHAVLFASKGNKLRAAEVLGISRSTLYRMLGSTNFTPTTDPDHHQHDTGLTDLRIAS